MDTKENMEFEFKELTSLKEFLGYNDLRTITQWCTKNGFEVILIGRKKYITQRSWNNYLFQKQNLGVDIDLSITDSNNNSYADRQSSFAGKTTNVNAKSHSFNMDNYSPSKELAKKFKTQIK